MAKGASQLRGYLIGFAVGVVVTVLFFYFEGWSYFASGGDKVERRLRRGVDHMTEKVEDAGDDVTDKADEWVDKTFKK